MASALRLGHARARRLRAPWKAKPAKSASRCMRCSCGKCGRLPGHAPAGSYGADYPAPKAPSSISLRSFTFCPLACFIVRLQLRIEVRGVQSSDLLFLAMVAVVFEHLELKRGRQHREQRRTTWSGPFSFLDTKDRGRRDYGSPRGPGMQQGERRPAPKLNARMPMAETEALPGQLSPGADDSTTFHETPQHFAPSLVSSPLSEHLQSQTSTTGHFPFTQDHQAHRSAAERRQYAKAGPTLPSAPPRLTKTPAQVSLS